MCSKRSVTGLILMRTPTVHDNSVTIQNEPPSNCNLRRNVLDLLILHIPGMMWHFTLDSTWVSRSFWCDLHDIKRCNIFTRDRNLMIWTAVLCESCTGSFWVYSASNQRTDEVNPDSLQSKNWRFIDGYWRLDLCMVPKYISLKSECSSLKSECSSIQIRWLLFIARDNLDKCELNSAGNTGHSLVHWH